jgi:hypothetical protein
MRRRRRWRSPASLDGAHRNNTTTQETRQGPKVYGHLTLVWSAPASPRCDWQPKCHGAVQIRAHFTVLGLWHADLWSVLELPDRHCDNCPVVRSGWELAS